MNALEITIEEFEQGAWIADIVSRDQFAGSFTVGDDTWTGTKVTERLEGERYYTRVVGGAGGLSKQVLDKYYDGQVALSVALQDLCRDCGETYGAAQAGAFLAPFERLRGSAASALDVLAAATNATWWIGRDGTVQMQSARTSSAIATGVQDTNTADVDSSIDLVNPSSVQIGGMYDSKMIRHVRWHLTAERFTARVFFVPFIFRPPTDNRYACLYSARVDKDNGDGTVDVIAAGRFGVTRVPLLSGVPHSKVKVDGGDLVMLGFFGADPQAPFCVAMGQDITATKKAARATDPVKVTITAAQLTALAFEFVSPAGPCVYTPGGTPPATPPGATGLDVTGTITDGTGRLLIGDA